MRINTIRLRSMIGWFGIMLPWIVLLLSMLNGTGFPESISATYHVDAAITPFMIILGSASLLLVCYKGYDLIDDIVCTLAGVFGLCICLFPCKPTLIDYSISVGTFQINSNISNMLHCISAICFFGLLAYNSLFLFTKGNGIPSKKKLMRNIIYRTCGVGMILSFIALIPMKLFDIKGGTWLVEMFALTFFGISWLTKSDVYPFLFCDSALCDKETDNA